MNKLKILFYLAISLTLAGCSGSGGTTFIYPDYNFSYVERIAVIPLENLSDDQGAGARTTRYLVSGLLATEAFDVVEPGDVSQALANYSLVRTGELTQEQAIELGKTLGAQGLILGSVGESADVRSGGNTVHVVTLDLHMVETDTGVTVWSTTQTEDSSSFWSSLFGTSMKSMSEVTRACVYKSINTLVK